MRRDAIIFVFGLVLAFVTNVPLLLTEVGLSLGAVGLLLIVARRTRSRPPVWAMPLWFAGCLWVGFINVFGEWFVSQM